MSVTPIAHRPRLAPSPAPEMPVDLDRPILVCGVGRSGTSLLHSMLNAHPAIAFPPETHFFRRYVAARGLAGRIARGGRGEFTRKLEQDADFRRLDLSPTELLLEEVDGALDTTRLFRRMLELHARRAGKSRIGDKDPRNIDHLEALRVAFPGALVLHVMRDPREVLLSRTKAAWSRNRPWWQHVLLAEDQLRRGRRLGPELFGTRYMEVRYEELVREPERVLGAVAAHIDVPYSPTMLDFSASAATLVDTRERAWKQETLGPLLRDNVEKWRTGLTTTQVRFVEAASREAFDRVGYERSLPRRGALAGLARGAAGLVLHARRALEARR